MTSLFDLTPAELTAWVTAQNQPAYRAQQILEAVYRQGAVRFEEIRQIPQSLREALAREFSLWSLQPAEVRRSEDGTVKYLSRLPDGELIETVLIPSNSRQTVCVSTQVGCAYSCTFCASGLDGFRRNLTAGEIVQEVLLVDRELAAGGAGGRLPPPRPQDPELRRGSEDGRRNAAGDRTRSQGRHVTNVVFMGMGEPLANYANLLKAIRILNAPEGMGIGARKITISTVGIVPKIEQLSKEGLQVELAISLHAPNDELRGQIMPVNRRYHLRELIAACRRFARKTKRLLTFEYILIDRVNDEVEHAQELAKLLKGLPAKVNLIPCHPIPGMPFARPPKARMLAFERALKAGDIVCTLRRSRGLDIEGACGQLRLRYNEPNAARHDPHP